MSLASNPGPRPKETMANDTHWQDQQQDQQQDRQQDQLVTFRLGREIYGVEISRIQEVIHLQEITAIPNAPEFIDGVIELRDRVIPVVDLKRRLGVAEFGEGKQRIVILDLRDRLLGMIVDDMSKVLMIPESRYEKLPEAVVGDRERNCISRLAKTEEGLIIVLEPERILSEVERRLLRQFDRSTE